MSVTLNADASEFRPGEFLAYVQNGFQTMNKTIRLSNNLPVGAAYKQYRPVSDFDVVTQRFSHNVFHQLNNVFVTELSSVRLRDGDSEFNMERLIDANDNILDRIYMNIECVEKGVEPNQPTERKQIGPGGYHNPIVTTIKVGSATFTGAKNITRPQLYFKEAVDNSDALFIPKISHKPNSIRSLALELEYNKEGEIIGYLHPYLTELTMFSPKACWLKSDAAPSFPPPLEDTKLFFIDTEVEVNNLVTHLNMVDVIGVDVEHHSYRTYQGFTCVIQITTYKGDFIIDALAVREFVYKLNEPFTNPNILKIFHGAEMDIQWLQRDFNVYVVGMFDTHKAAIVLNHPLKSLAALLKRYCSLDVDKSYQLADWRLRPLTEDMIKYARIDTHYLLYIWACMRDELLSADKGNTEKLLEVFKYSKKVCLITYNKPTCTENSHMDLYYRNKKPFSVQQLAVLKMLYHWRDAQARTLDESTMYLLPNHMLLAISEYMPNDEQGITAICNPMPPFVKQNLGTMLRMILSCREAVAEPQINPDAGERLLSMEPAPQVQHDFLNERRENFPQNQEIVTAPMPQMGFNSETAQRELIVPYVNATTVAQYHPFVMVNVSTGAAYYYLRPYDRYQHYRTLTQQVEVVQQKEKKAKLTAPSDSLVKPEVLLLLQKAEETVDTKGTKEIEPSTSNLSNNKPSSKKTSRKNKNKDRLKKNVQGITSPDAKKKSFDTKSSSKLHLDKTAAQKMDSSSKRLAHKPYDYKNAKYLKFRKYEQVEVVQQKEKKAKLTAPSDSLVKPEVLLLLQKAEETVDTKGTKEIEPSTSNLSNNKPSSKKTSRKNKNKDRLKKNVQGITSPDAKKKSFDTKSSSKLHLDKTAAQKMDSSSKRLAHKPYDYKNAKYLKFRSAKQRKIQKKQSKH